MTLECNRRCLSTIYEGTKFIGTAISGLFLTQYRSKPILAYHFPSCMTLDNDLECLSTIEKAPRLDLWDWGGAKLVILVNLHQLLAPRKLFKPKN